MSSSQSDTNKHEMFAHEIFVSYRENEGECACKATWTLSSRLCRCRVEGEEKIGPRLDTTGKIVLPKPSRKQQKPMITAIQI